MPRFNETNRGTCLYPPRPPFFPATAPPAEYYNYNATSTNIYGFMHPGYSAAAVAYSNFHGRDTNYHYPPPVHQNIYMNSTLPPSMSAEASCMTNSNFKM
jgi:hypothetical protein